MISQAMLHVAVLAQLSLVAASSEPRHLSYPRLAGYEPISGVADHALIDLDQKEIEDALNQNDPNFAKARAIYLNGANSGPYARVTVPELPAAIQADQTVKQAGNEYAKGVVKSDRGTGVKEVDITYNSKCIDNAYSSKESTTGCFSTNGAITVAGQVNIGAPSVVKNMYRTLSGLSTEAGSRMMGEETFTKFTKYYQGRADYADRYVKAALDGNGAFAGQAKDARVQGVKKGTAYMNAWMYVIHKMEQGIKECTANTHKNDANPIYAWDAAVAFYVGSLEGLWGAGSGVLLHNLADMRCKNFKTCSPDGGDAIVNEDIMTNFKLGQEKILSGKCNQARPFKKKIVSLMTVPLIQGSLRYAYKVDQLGGGAKEKAEGAVFSAAVLPMVHACSESAAKTIATNMDIDTAAPMKDGFVAVKTAFESVYGCLEIQCAHVGGLVISGDEYYKLAGPCGPPQVSAAAGNSKVLLSAMVILSIIMHATQ